MPKTLLITGASSGIDKATARRFHAEGWNVIATMRSPEQETELDLLDRVLVTRLDVLDIASIRTAVGAGLARFGRIDALLNNAGYGAYGPLEATPLDKVRRQFDVNIIGLLATTQALLPHFRRQRDGVIVNISLIGGRMTFALGTIYHGTKFAVEGLSESRTTSCCRWACASRSSNPAWSRRTSPDARSTSATIRRWPVRRRDISRRHPGAVRHRSLTIHPMHASTYAFDATWRLLLKDLGVSTANVLRRAGLPEDLLAQPSVRLEAAAFHRFWDSLAAELADPMLPLTLCRAIRGEAFSPPLLAALSSPNFQVAVQRIARYKALVAPMRLEVREDAERVTLGLVWPDRANQPPASLVATELLFFVALARMGTRELVRPLQVVTTAPPGPEADYAEFLGVSIRTGASHELVFAKADAQRPFLTSSEGLWAAFEPELRTRLAQLDASVSVGQRARAALLEALPSGVVGMQAVSDRLAMSTRSLQRHLESEGLSYQQLLQETRHAVARHYLQKTDLPAAEISFLLGFEEPNSFYRAFRGWTGHTPARVRQQSRVPS